MTDQPTDSQVDVEEIRDLFLFEGLDEDQLRWIAERCDVRAFPAGTTVYRFGQPSEALWVLLEGGLRLLRPSGEEDLLVNETEHRGTYSGAVRAFVSGSATSYETTVVTTRPSRFLRFPADDFAAFVRRTSPMAVHLLDGMYLGIRASDATIRQREHLAQLGALSANLAHELNNPAAAAVRATAQLRSRVSGMRAKLGKLASGALDASLLARLVDLQERAVERAGKQRRALSPLEESDLEDELVDRLEELGVTDSLVMAPVFAAAGMDVAWLEEVAEHAGDDVDPAFHWLAYTLETEALMDEIEDASGRISTLVGSVKEYSHLGQASYQEVDVHPGLDSTLVMLGSKLRGVEVRREYGADLPKVPAYPAELNQVWTNLIDNAVDAMEGAGVLVLRTRAEGGSVVVEVADEGPGIPEEVRDRVFEAFVTTKPAGKGSGLGLDNALRIVERRHRGSLTFTTGPGGTTFTARLPSDGRPPGPGDGGDGDGDDGGDGDGGNEEAT